MYQNHSNVMVWKVNFISTVKFIATRKEMLCFLIVPKRILSSEINGFFSFLRNENHTSGEGDWALELRLGDDALYVKRTFPIKEMLAVIEESHVFFLIYLVLYDICIN